jgi:hypothetical protein
MGSGACRDVSSSLPSPHFNEEPQMLARRSMRRIASPRSAAVDDRNRIRIIAASRVPFA